MKRPWHPVTRPRSASLVEEVLSMHALYDIHPDMALPAEKTNEVAIAVHMAMADMVAGRGTEDGWGAIAVALNISLVLCEWGFGEEHTGKLIEAQEGAFRARVRHGRTGKCGLDGAAIMAIDLALHIHELQLAMAPQERISAALKEVQSRNAAGEIFAEAA